MPIKIGVIGVGYLGKFHAEKYARLPEAELVGVMDIDQARAKEIAARYKCQAFFELSPLLEKVEAVSVVVPTKAHFEVAKACIAEGKHVLLEKPMTTTLEEADTLIDLAAKKGVILQIGHLERFNPAVKALFSYLHKPMFVETHRLGLCLERGTDVDVILDLMIHDIDIILAAVPEEIVEIRAVGVPVISGNIDIANVRLEFTNGCVANLTASRITGKRMRKIRFFQKDAYFSLDYAKRELAIIRRQEGGPLPFFHKLLRFAEGDPLQAEIASFLEVIKEGKRPVVSGEDGRKALKVALEINKRIKERIERFGK